MSTRLFVVELEDGRAYLGRLLHEHGHLVVQTGLRGRPPVLDPDDVVSIVPADEHPDVVEVAA